MNSRASSPCRHADRRDRHDGRQDALTIRPFGRRKGLQHEGRQNARPIPSRVETSDAMPSRHGLAYGRISTMRAGPAARPAASRAAQSGKPVHCHKKAEHPAGHERCALVPLGRRGRRGRGQCGRMSDHCGLPRSRREHRRHDSESPARPGPIRVVTAEPPMGVEDHDGSANSMRCRSQRAIPAASRPPQRPAGAVYAVSNGGDRCDQAGAVVVMCSMKSDIQC